MTDLEITRLCAEAMGINAQENDDGVIRYLKSGIQYRKYIPLHDDAQAMALVKKFQMLVRWDGGVHGWTAGLWYVGGKGQSLYTDRSAQDLNHAICECVAKMQAAKPALSPVGPLFDSADTK